MICRIELCPSGRVEGDEGCDDGNSIDDDGCQSDCTPTAQVDALLKPVRPVHVTIPASAGSMRKRVRLRVAHAEVGGVQTVRLSASDGSCPAGTVTAQPDFDRSQAGVQDVAALAPGERAYADLFLEFARAAFAIVDRKAPHRCTVLVAAASAAGTFDVTGPNNTASVVVDVSDASAPSGQVSEIMLKPVVPQAMRIPAGLLGDDRRLQVRVRGSTGAGTTLAANDGSCPPGTLSVLRQPGTTATGEVQLRASRAFVTTTAVSPARCTAVLTASQVGDTEPSNNTTEVVLDVIDRNDF